MRVCVHGDDFMVESRIDVFQDVKAMLEHKVDINVIAIIGPRSRHCSQDRQANPILEPCRFHVESESQACV